MFLGKLGEQEGKLHPRVHMANFPKKKKRWVSKEKPKKRSPETEGEEEGKTILKDKSTAPPQRGNISLKTN